MNAIAPLRARLRRAAGIAGLLAPLPAPAAAHGAAGAAWSGDDALMAVSLAAVGAGLIIALVRRRSRRP